MLAVQRWVGGQRLRIQIAQQPLPPVVAAIAQNERFKGGEIQVVEQLVFELARPARINPDGLPRAAARGVAVQAQSDVAAERQRAVRLEILNRARPLPRRTLLHHVVVHRRIDAVDRAEQVRLVRCNGHHRQRVAVGAGRRDNIRMRRVRSRRAVFENARAHGVELEHGAVRSLPIILAPGAVGRLNRRQIIGC